MLFANGSPFLTLKYGWPLCYAKPIMAANYDPNEPVTRGMLNEAVDAILKGMDKIAKELKSEIEGVRSELKGTRNELKGEMQELKVEVRYLKDDMNGLKAEFSDTPSRREFNELKARVDKYHPLS